MSETSGNCDRWPSVLGLGGAASLMGFMATTLSFFGEPDYQRWKWSH
ncbi:MAG: hypothetical protein WD601_06620 [Pseudohongiellaceae bacterium]